MQTRNMPDKFMLRLPDGLRDRVRGEADRNCRSMNAEIVFQLSRAYAQPETQTADAQRA